MNVADLPVNWASKIEVSEAGCWVWTGCRQPNGYGKLGYHGRTLLAHRACFEWLRGPIPDGLQLDHLCRTRSCVNPDHLEPVTCLVILHRSAITLTAQEAAVTHCPEGHPYDEANTYVRPDRAYSRDCRACRRASSQRRWAKLKKGTRQAA